MKKFAQDKFVIKNPEKYIGNHTPYYRSSWEFAFMKMCDENSSITKWASESIKIPYRNPFTGKYTVYVPDFFIVYNDKTGKQHVELIEIKPSQQTFEKIGNSLYNRSHFQLNQAKWSAAKQFCKQKGINFRVVNEQDIFHNGKRK